MDDALRGTRKSDAFIVEASGPGKERRHGKRIRTDKSYFIGCKSGDSDSRFSDPNLAVKLLDLSARGACFVSRIRLKAGLRVQVLIVRPGAGTRSSVDAAVRWVESVERDGRVAHVAGVEFDRPMAGLGLPEEPERPKPAAPKPTSNGVDPRRHHRRFKPDKTTLVCVPRDSLLRKLGLKPNAGFRLVDLSLGGAQIVCLRSLERGEEVDLQVILEDGKTTFHAEAKVSWCRRDTLSLKPRWNVGLRFGPLTAEAKRVLLEIQQLHIR